MKQLLLDIQPAPAQTLDNFVIGHNAEALASIQHLLTDSAESSFIYLWGPTGSGKSHLLTAAHNLGVYIADDVHLLDSAAQVDLFNTYNQLKASGSKLIAAGLHAPSQMQLRDDLATRLAWGLVYQLQPLTDKEK